MFTPYASLVCYQPYVVRLRTSCYQRSPLGMLCQFCLADAISLCQLRWQLTGLSILRLCVANPCNAISYPRAMPGADSKALGGLSWHQLQSKPWGRWSWHQLLIVCLCIVNFSTPNAISKGARQCTRVKKKLPSCAARGWFPREGRTTGGLAKAKRQKKVQDTSSADCTVVDKFAYWSLLHRTWHWFSQWSWKLWGNIGNVKEVDKGVYAISCSSQLPWCFVNYPCWCNQCYQPLAAHPWHEGGSW